MPCMVLRRAQHSSSTVYTLAAAVVLHSACMMGKGLSTAQQHGAAGGADIEFFFMHASDVLSTAQRQDRTHTGCRTAMQTALA